MHPIINIALRAARRAGRIIVRAMDRVGTLRVEEKAKNDFVSEIDRAAEDVIIDTIMRAYPDHGVIGEERGAANEDAEFVWVIDPLDGTSNYLAGIPHFCVSIGVRRGPVLEHGVIVDPVRNEEFSATRGEGARLNGRRLRVSRRVRLDNSIIATGIPYRMVADHIDGYADMHRSLQASCRSIRRMGSAALDLAYVGAGAHRRVRAGRAAAVGHGGGGGDRARSGWFCRRCGRRRPVHGGRPPGGGESSDIQGPVENRPPCNGNAQGLKG